MLLLGMQGPLQFQPLVPGFFISLFISTCLDSVNLDCYKTGTYLFSSLEWEVP